MNGRDQDTRSVNSGSGEFGGLYTVDVRIARLDSPRPLASASDISEVEKATHFLSLSCAAGNALCGGGILLIEPVITGQQMRKAAVMRIRWFLTGMQVKALCC